MGIAVLPTFLLLTAGSGCNLDHSLARSPQEVTVEEQQWLHVASQRNEKADLSTILMLLRVEECLGLFDTYYRGLLVAAAWIETGGTFWHDVRPGDDGRAIGLLQLWPWASRRIDRWDPVANAVFWLTTVLNVAKNRTSDCPDPVWAAETAVSRGKWTCRSRTSHYRTHRRWRRKLNL